MINRATNEKNNKVDILLSVYRPRLDYLKKQLISIDNQTYQNIELYIYDDCIEQKTNHSFILEYVKNVPVTFLPSQKRNLGYAKAFEFLVSQSKGDYIAFCDQDDIWRPNKIEDCVAELQKSGSLLVASDRSIIDENDNIVIDSVRQTSNKMYDNWHTGDDIAKYNAFSTFAVGMSVVMCGDFARQNIPVSQYTGHDKWFISCAATEGQVSFVDKPLVKYRRHGKNVSGVLNGINSKKDYYFHRVMPHHNLVLELIDKYPDYSGNNEMLCFSNARVKHDINQLLKYRKLSPVQAYFEIILACIPDFLFDLFLKAVKLLF